MPLKNEKKINPQTSPFAIPSLKVTQLENAQNLGGGSVSMDGEHPLKAAGPYRAPSR